MNDALRTAFRAAAESAPVIGDPMAARHAAQRRRTRRWAGSAAAVVVLCGLVWAGSVHVADRADPPPSHPVTPSPSAPAAPRAAADAEGRALLYRSCDGPCHVGMLDSAFDVDLRAPLAEQLADAGLDGVSLSPGGLFVAIPHDGALTVTHVYSQPELSVDVPAGPAGSQWRPAFWSRGEAYLEIAQWTGDRVTAVGVVDLAFDENFGLVGAGTPTVHTRTVAGSHSFVPVEMGAAVDNLVGVAPAGHDPTTYALQYLRVGPSIYTGHTKGFRLSWASCLHPGESLLGPDRARTTYTVAHDTSNDQRTATVVYRTSDHTPVAISNGDARCGSAGTTHYELPTSSDGVTWRLLGPMNHRFSLMTRDKEDGSVDVVAVSAQGERVIHTLPAGSEVVAPGMTGGYFD